MAKASAKKTAKPAAKKAAPAKPAKKPAAKLVSKSTASAKKPAPKKPAAKPAPKAKVPAKPLAKAAPVPVKLAIKPKRVYKPAKLPAGYKPTASEPYMNPQQEEYFRQKLLTWRKSLMDESRETLDHLHEENWHQADIADRASLETEAGVELRTRNRYLKLISKIDSAIRRIEAGDYGYCEETGEPIGLKRLEARPVATLSIEAQERHEKTEKQYVDED
jgi:DnaK suppressor protein